MKRIDGIYIVIGIFYLVAGMVLGIVMGTRQDFQLAPVHAHLNLVGFVSHSVFGLVHGAWPVLRAGMIASLQFWLFVLGTPLFVAGIAISILGGVIWLAVSGSTLALFGALLFLIMMLRTGLTAEAP